MKGKMTAFVLSVMCLVALGAGCDRSDDTVVGKMDDIWSEMIDMIGNGNNRVVLDHTDTAKRRDLTWADRANLAAILSEARESFNIGRYSGGIGPGSDLIVTVFDGSGNCLLRFQNLPGTRGVLLEIRFENTSGYISGDEFKRWARGLTQ